MLKIPEVFERDGDFIKFTQSFLHGQFKLQRRVDRFKALLIF